jgi:AraC-like DNA-binding protein
MPAKPYRIRAAVLTGLPEFARQHGVDLLAALARAGVPESALTDPNLKVPVAAVNDLFEQLSALTGVAHVGLVMSNSITFARMGVVGQYALRYPTIDTLSPAITSHIHAHNEALSYWFETSGDVTVVHVEFVSGLPILTNQMTEMAMGTVYGNYRAVAGPQWKPQGIYFRHPSSASSEADQFFGLKVSFGSEFDGMLIKTADMALPNRLFRPEVAQTVANAVRDDVTHAVRGLVCSLLPSGRCRVETVAGMLGINRRTLHRRLSAAEASFVDIVNGVRTEYALRYLAVEDRPVSAVADMLGFPSQANFSYWFRRQIGLSPSTWRRNQHALKTTLTP